LHTRQSIAISAAISPDGNWIAIGGFGALEIWDARSNDFQSSFPMPVRQYVAFSPDGKWLVSGSGREYQIREVGTWNLRQRLADNPSSGLLRPMAFSRDGRMLAIGITHDTVQLIDTATWRELATLEAPHPTILWSLSFSPDGTHLAVGSKARLSQLWDLRLIRRQLAAMNLDWELPPYPPEDRLRQSKPLRVTVEAGPRRTGPLSEADRAERVRTKISARDPQTPLYLLDLTQNFNATLDENILRNPDARATLSVVPQGRQTLAGVEFDVRGLIQLSSRLLKDIDSSFPERVEGISVAQECRRLHFLQANSWNGPERGEVGRYVVHFADGQTVEFPLVYGAELRSMNLSSNPTPRATVAWTGTNAAHQALRLFKTTWENPRPDVAIETLDFISQMTAAAPFVLAITAE
jgi:hypothetical protein